jgi:hypothetical protein
MKITNKFNLPQPLVTLASKEYYSKGDSEYSTTEIMAAPRVKRMQEQYKHMIERDVVDVFWSLMGSAIHAVLERGMTENHIKEERIFARVDGVTISGAIDIQELTDDGVVVWDYKFTSAWTVMNEKVAWEQQLNIYRWFIETVKNVKVKSIKVCAIIRDFSEHKTQDNYPEAKIVVRELPMWELNKTEQFIRERLELHRNAKVAQDFGEPLPECTPEERWESETTYAVKREGRKTAIRVFKSIDEANQLAEKEKGYVETRLGEPKCCTGNYCGVANWCDQFKRDTIPD